jgi:hypothetical protein
VRIPFSDLTRNHKPLWREGLMTIIVILARLVERARRAFHAAANPFDQMLPPRRWGRYDDVPPPDWFKRPPPPL